MFQSNTIAVAIVVMTMSASIGHTLPRPRPFRGSGGSRPFSSGVLHHKPTFLNPFVPPVPSPFGENSLMRPQITPVVESSPPHQVPFGIDSPLNPHHHHNHHHHPHPHPHSHPHHHPHPHHQHPHASHEHFLGIVSSPPMYFMQGSHPSPSFHSKPIFYHEKHSLNEFPPGFQPHGLDLAFPIPFPPPPPPSPPRGRMPPSHSRFPQQSSGRSPDSKVIFKPVVKLVPVEVPVKVKAPYPVKVPYPVEMPVPVKIIQKEKVMVPVAVPMVGQMIPIALVPNNQPAQNGIQAKDQAQQNDQQQQQQNQQQQLTQADYQLQAQSQSEHHNHEQQQFQQQQQQFQQQQQQPPQFQQQQQQFQQQQQQPPQFQQQQQQPPQFQQQQPPQFQQQQPPQFQQQQPPQFQQQQPPQFQQQQQSQQQPTTLPELIEKTIKTQPQLHPRPSKYYGPGEYQTVLFSSFDGQIFDGAEHGQKQNNGQQPQQEPTQMHMVKVAGPSTSYRGISDYSLGLPPLPPPPPEEFIQNNFNPNNNHPNNFNNQGNFNNFNPDIHNGNNNFNMNNRETYTSYVAPMRNYGLESTYFNSNEKNFVEPKWRPIPAYMNNNNGPNPPAQKFHHLQHQQFNGYFDQKAAASEENKSNSNNNNNNNANNEYSTFVIEDRIDQPVNVPEYLNSPQPPVSIQTDYITGKLIPIDAKKSTNIRNKK